MPTLTARKFSDLTAVIRAAREDAGLSQDELAQRLAFSRDYMSDLESGRGSLYIKRLFRVLHELGIVVTVSYTPARQREQRDEHQQQDQQHARKVERASRERAVGKRS